MDKNNSTPAPGSDTEHLASQVIVQKRSHKNLYIVLVVAVAVIVAAVAGLYLYKVKVVDPNNAKQAALASPSPSATPKTPEQQVSATLTDNAQKQADALKQNDDTKYLKDSTAAAQSVGRNLNEQSLSD